MEERGEEDSLIILNQDFVVFGYCICFHYTLVSILLLLLHHHYVFAELIISYYCYYYFYMQVI